MTDVKLAPCTPLIDQTPDPSGIPIDMFLPHMARMTFSSGEFLFRQGDPATEMFYVEQGRIVLPELGKTLGPGDIIGEMGMFCPTNERTVSAVCEDDLVVYRMDREGVLALMDRRPRDVLALIQLAISRFAENLRAETAAKERIQSELRIARDIQVSSLPGDFPAFPDRTEFDLFASMDPAKEIGGDFYDFFFIDDNTLFFAVGDVSGKGVPAALFMMTVKTLLKTEAVRGAAPAELLRAVNNLIWPDNSSLMFVTILCATLNVKTGDVTIGNAGHNPPLVSTPDAGAEFAPAPGSPVLGLARNVTPSEATLTLAPGQAIFLYTDGIPEAVDRKDNFYSDERLRRTLTRLADMDMKAMVNGVRADVKRFARGAPQFDDVTMLAVRFNGQVRRDLAHLTIPADIGALEQLSETIRECAGSLGLGPEKTGDLELIAEEVLANIVNHAYPDRKGTVEIDCSTRDAGELTLEFSDQGTPFDVLAAPDPDLPPDIAERNIGGLGIFLVKRLADDVSYRRENDRNILTITVRPAPSQPTGGSKEPGHAQ